MGFFKSLAKLGNVFDDPVSKALRKQGGALGTVGNIMNPGGAVNQAITNGAPINARTMLDPNGWMIPTPPPPEVPPEPLAPLVPGAPTSLPAALQPRPVQYSQPTTSGPLTNLAFQMSGAPTNLPPAPALPRAPSMPTHDVGIPSVPPNIQALLDQPATSTRGRMLQMALRNAMQNGQGQQYRPTPGGGVEPIFGTSQSGLPMLDPLTIARLGMYS
jgi:hypothetical protein